MPSAWRVIQGRASQLPTQKQRDAIFVVTLLCEKPLRTQKPQPQTLTLPTTVLKWCQQQHSQPEKQNSWEDRPPCTLPLSVPTYNFGRTTRKSICPCPLERPIPGILRDPLPARTGWLVAGEDVTCCGTHLHAEMRCLCSVRRARTTVGWWLWQIPSLSKILSLIPSILLSQ